jgi:hypothetical protein
MKNSLSNRFGAVLTAAVIALVAGAQDLSAQDRTGRVTGPGGINQRDSRLPSSTPISPGAAGTSQSPRHPLEADSAEPPDCATGFDLDDAYKGYLKRKREAMDVVARADVDK